MKFLGVIPARYGSTRFPGKPLADVQGKSMIWRVYNQAQKAEILNSVVVATDDQRIFDHVKEFGGEVVMTSVDHENGTARCYEAFCLIQKSNPEEQFDVVINIQGDEPFIEPSQIEKLGKLFNDAKTEIGTLAKRIKLTNDLINPNVVKVVIGSSGKALYFSRQAIPFLRDVPQNQWTDQFHFFRHIGLYAYRTDILAGIIKYKPGKLEKAENLEQLRWLENGCQIRVEQTNFESISVDTPEDLSKINNNH